MWKIIFGIFIISLRFETPWVRKNGFYDGVYLSSFLGVRFDILLQGPKRKDEFVNQPHPTKIVKIGTLFVFLEKNFMKKSKISILCSDSSYKFLLIIVITFFDLTKIRKVTVC